MDSESYREENALKRAKDKVEAHFFKIASIFCSFPFPCGKRILCLLYLVETCQSLAFVLSPRLFWDSSYLGGFFNIFLIAPAVGFRAGLFWSVLGCVCIFSFCILVVVPWSHARASSCPSHSRRRRCRFFLKSSRNLYRAFSSVLFLPLICILLSSWRPDGTDSVPSNSVLPQVFGTLTAAALSAIVLPLQLLVINRNPIHSVDMMSSPSGRSRLIMKVSHLCLAVGFMTFPDEIVASSVFILAVVFFAALVLFRVLYYLPYFNPFSNCVACAHAITFFASACFAFITQLFAPHNYVLTVCATIVPFVCGWSLGCRLPLLVERYMARWPADRPPDDPYHVELMTRAAMREYAQQAKSESAEPTEKSESLLSSMNEIFVRGARHCPRSSYVHYSHALFLFHVKGDQAMGYSALHKAENLSHKFDMKFHVQILRNKFQSGQKSLQARRNAYGHSTKPEGSVDLLSFIEFQRSFDSAKNMQREAKRHLSKFWERVFVDGLELETEEAMRLISQVESASTKSKKLYYFLLGKYPGSPRILRSYAKFLRDVMNDSAKAMTVMEKAMKADEEMKRRLSSDEAESELRADMLDETCGIMTINHCGIIQGANRRVRAMFGYKKSQLIGENIKMLMPNPYKRNHDGYLHRYMETNCPHVVGKGQRFVMGRHSNGTVIPIKLAVHRVDIGHDVLFTGILHAVPSHVSLITVASDFKITGANERACKLLGYSTKTIVGKPVEKFIPKLSDNLDTLKLVGKVEAMTVHLRHKKVDLFDLELALNSEGGMEVYIITLRLHAKAAILQSNGSPLGLTDPTIDDDSATEAEEDDQLLRQDSTKSANTDDLTATEVRLGATVSSLLQTRKTSIRKRIAKALAEGDSPWNAASFDGLSLATTTYTAHSAPIDPEVDAQVPYEEEEGADCEGAEVNDEDLQGPQPQLAPSTSDYSLCSTAVVTPTHAANQSFAQQSPSLTHSPLSNPQSQTPTPQTEETPIHTVSFNKLQFLKFSPLWDTKSPEIMARAAECVRMRGRIKRAMAENEQSSVVNSLQYYLFWILFAILVCSFALFALAVPMFDLLQNETSALDLMGSSLILATETAVRMREIVTCASATNQTETACGFGSFSLQISFEALALAVQQLKVFQDQVLLDGKSYPSIVDAYEGVQYSLMQVTPSTGGSDRSTTSANLWESVSQYISSANLCATNSTNTLTSSPYPSDQNFYFVVQNGAGPIFDGLLSTLQLFSTTVVRGDLGIVWIGVVALFAFPTALLLLSFVLVILPALKRSSGETTRMTAVFSNVCAKYVPGLAKKLVASHDLEYSVPSEVVGGAGGARIEQEDSEDSHSSASEDERSPRSVATPDHAQQSWQTHPIVSLTLSELHKKQKRRKRKLKKEKQFTLGISSTNMLQKRGSVDNSVSTVPNSALAARWPSEASTVLFENATFSTGAKIPPLPTKDTPEKFAPTLHPTLSTASLMDVPKVKTTLTTWRRELSLTRSFCIGAFLIVVLFLAFCLLMVYYWSFWVTPSMEIAQNSYERHARLLQALFYAHDAVATLPTNRTNANAPFLLSLALDRAWELHRGLGYSENALNFDSQKSVVFGAVLENSEVVAAVPEGATLFAPSGLNDLLADFSEAAFMVLRGDGGKIVSPTVALDYFTDVVADLRGPLNDSTALFLAQFRANSELFRSVACFLATLTVLAVLVVYVFVARNLVRKINLEKHNFLFLLLLIPDEAVVSDHRVSRPLVSVVSQL